MATATRRRLPLVGSARRAKRRRFSEAQGGLLLFIGAALASFLALGLLLVGGIMALGEPVPLGRYMLVHPWNAYPFSELPYKDRGDRLWMGAGIKGMREKWRRGEWLLLDAGDLGPG
jgi:hypothetical protein